MHLTRKTHPHTSPLAIGMRRRRRRRRCRSAHETSTTLNRTNSKSSHQVTLLSMRIPPRSSLAPSRPPHLPTLTFWRRRWLRCARWSRRALRRCGPSRRSCDSPADPSFSPKPATPSCSLTAEQQDMIHRNRAPTLARRSSHLVQQPQPQLKAAIGPAQPSHDTFYVRCAQGDDDTVAVRALLFPPWEAIRGRRCRARRHCRRRRRLLRLNSSNSRRCRRSRRPVPHRCHQVLAPMLVCLSASPTSSSRPRPTGGRQARARRGAPTQCSPRCRARADALFERRLPTATHRRGPQPSSCPTHSHTILRPYKMPRSSAA